MDVQAHDYYAAKRADQTRGTIGLPATPRWLNTIPHVYNLTAPFSMLLDQLPTVRATHNEIVIKNYFKSLVAELIKIYVYRLRIVELSDTIPESDKPARLDQLITECRQYITELSTLLGYGHASPTI